MNGPDQEMLRAQLEALGYSQADIRDEIQRVKETGSTAVVTEARKQARKVCAWCGVTLATGPEPASHGICSECYEDVMGESLEESMEDMRQTPEQVKRAEQVEDALQRQQLREEILEHGLDRHAKMIIDHHGGEDTNRDLEPSPSHSLPLQYLGHVLLADHTDWPTGVIDVVSLFNEIRRREES